MYNFLFLIKMHSCKKNNRTRYQTHLICDIFIILKHIPNSHTVGSWITQYTGILSCIAPGNQ